MKNAQKSELDSQVAGDLDSDSIGMTKSSSRAKSTQVVFARLVSENLAFVWRTLRRCGVPMAEVDDAAQRVFLVAHDKLDTIAPGSERAFLIGVATRVASHARRTNQRREAAHQRFIEYQNVATSADGLAHRTETRELLDRALDKMPDELRSVFVLFEIEELTVTEIAELLQLPRGTVATRLRRARMVFQVAAKSIAARTDEERDGRS